MSAEAPTRFVRLLLAGFITLSIAIVGIFIGPIVYEVVSFALPTPNATGMAAIGTLWVGINALWPIGIWMITTRRPKSETTIHAPILDNARVRLGIRIVSCAWAIKAIFAMALAGMSTGAAPATGFGAGTLLAGQLVFSFISWIGLVPTCIYIGEIAYWSANESMGSRLRSTAWAMGVFGAISVLMTAVALTPFMISSPAGIVAVFCLIIVAIATIVFMVSVMQLSGVLIWVIKHQMYSAGSQDRVTARLNAEKFRPGCISNHLRCGYCRFDLQGLPYGGHCPECGESYADDTPFPIRDPALSARDEPELDLAESSNQEILQFEHLDSLGKKRTGSDEDDGDIPLA